MLARVALVVIVATAIVAAQNSTVTTTMAPVTKQPFRLGLLDNYARTRAVEEMKVTMELLGLDVDIIVAPHATIRDLARIGKLDATYTPSDLFVCMATEYGVTPLAGVVRRLNDVDVAYSGGVMFTSIHSSVKSIDDFKGRVLAAIGRDSLLGFQAQRHELWKQGLNVYELFPQVIYTGNAEQVVWEVLNGTADVGFVTSGVIDAMVKQGLVFTPDINFLNEYNHRFTSGEAYPFRCSTGLFGEWVLASVGNLPEQLVHTAVSDLFEFNASHFEALGLSGISYFRPPLAYIDTLGLLEDLTIMVEDDSYQKSCEKMSSSTADVVCAFGWTQAKDVSCDTTSLYSCPEREGFNYTCVCEPCVQICPSDETYTMDGTCRCKTGFVRVGASCFELGVFIVQVIVPIALLVGLLIVYLLHRQRLKADGIWQVDPSELVIEQPAEVLGSGSFGVVLAAKLRGQMVAVKRAYVSKHGKFRTSSKTTESIMKSGTNNAYGLPFRSHRQQTGKSKERAARQLVRNVFAEAEAVAEKLGSTHGSTNRSGRATTMSRRPWYERLFGPSAETRARRQLFREMRLLSRMQHDNICRMVGAVVESGMEPLMILEYMEMGSLYSMLHNEAMDLDDDFRYNALHDITSGMRYLHNADLIHGDLKALNCLVDSKFHVKVSDFGMAGFASEHSQRGGTLSWMAPELLQGGITTFESDVYSFGIVMFEIFAREDPYEDVEYDTQMLVQNIVRRKLRPTPPSSMPPEFAVLMNEALASDPDTRPTFIELMRRIEPLEGKMKVNARKGAFQDNALLEQVFPKHIATALREGRTIEPEHHAEVTIFFSDICGFTDMSATLEPVQVSNMLDRLYTVFDKLCDKHGLYKIETIGDAYMCVGNLFTPQPDHAARVARFAMDALAGANAIPILEDEPDGAHIDIRVGFHSGPVVSNVVGTLTPRFCLFGSTVNCASRMESNSVRNCIHMSPEAAALVQKQDVSLNVIRRDPVVTIKGLGKMQTYWLGHAPPSEASMEVPVNRKSRKSQFSVASMRSLASVPNSRRPSNIRDLVAPPSPMAPQVMFDSVAVDIISDEPLVKEQHFIGSPLSKSAVTLKIDDDSSCGSSPTDLTAASVVDIELVMDSSV